MEGWNYSLFQNVDIGGARVYIDKAYIGLVRGESSVKYDTETVEVYQGVPRVLQGQIIRQRTGTVSIECLEMTPETYALASGDGSVEVENNPTTETTSNEPHQMQASGTKEFLKNENVSSATIVVKSIDGETTYTLNTDYVVGVDGSKTYLQLPATLGALSAGDDVLVSYSYSQSHYTHHLVFGTSSALNSIEDLVFVKKNDRNNKTLVLQLWKVQSKGNLPFVFNEDSSDVLGINLEFSIMSDTQNHSACPLGLPSWIDGDVDWDNLPVYPPANDGE